MAASAPSPSIPRETTADFDGLVREGESLDRAWARLERRKDFTKLVGTDAGQRLNEAIARGRGREIPVPKTNGAAATPAPADPITTAQRLELTTMPVDQLHIGDNVRVNVEGIDELAASIETHGVLQPIKVKDVGGRWEVIWGQRRLLAARKAGLARIPVIIVSALEPNDPAERAIEQLIENLHRADLAPLDRARAMRAVVDAGTSQADLARELGLHPSTIANDLGLLEAAPKVQQLIAEGQLTPSHYKALRGLAPKTQVEFAREAVDRGYSAHQLEQDVQRRRQQAEAIAQREREDAERTRQNLEQLRASIDELATKKKPGLDAEIIVFQDYYGQGDVKIRQLADALTKAGFTKVRTATRSGDVGPRPKGCDCTAWKATLHSTYSYQSGGYTTKLQVTTACVVAKHRQDKATADEETRREKYALEERVRAHVRQTAGGWALPESRAIAVDRLLGEAVLWSLLNYRLPEWSVEHGGKRNNAWHTIQALPDADLATEVAKEIARDFRDHAGYHVDWTGLAEQLGIAEASA